MALGWHYSHHLREENNISLRKKQAPFWLRTLANVALAQPGLQAVRLNVKEKPHQLHLFKPSQQCLESADCPADIPQDSSWSIETISATELSLEDEISQASLMLP